MNTDFGTLDILSRRETAAFLGICLTSLHHLDIPKTKVGHRVMYKREVINKWIDDHTEKAKKEKS